MDWRGILSVAARVIPGLKEAVAWMNRHSLGYEVRAEGEKVVVVVELDTAANAGVMARYLDSFMSAIIVNKRRIMRVVKR